MRANLAPTLLLAMSCCACPKGSTAATDPAPPGAASAAEAGAWPDDSCKGHTCESFGARTAGDAPRVLKGAAIEMTDLGRVSRIVVSWRTSEGALFVAMVSAQAGTMFPLPEGIVQLQYAQPMTQAPDGHTTPPYAQLLLDPDAASLPPLAPGHVFIPLSGEARLDGDVYTEARIEKGGDPALPSIRVRFQSPWFKGRTPPAIRGERGGLHAGDGFAWGNEAATITRIVPRAGASDGWVEVELHGRASGEAR